MKKGQYLITISKEQLYEDYIIREMKLQDVGKKYLTSKATILKRLKKFNIKKNTKRIITLHNYVCLYMPNHPMARQNGYILEHRLIISNHIGRMLKDSEVVDHINGVKNDNRIENLRLFNNHALHIKEEFNRGVYINNLKKLRTISYKGTHKNQPRNEEGRFI